MIVDKVCNLCGNKEVELISREVFNTFSTSVIRCKRCGLIYVDPQPPRINEYYNDDYLGELRSEFHTERLECFREVLNLTEKYCSPPGFLLDIGCGAGDFMKIAKERGWDVKGVDISDVAVEHVKNKLEFEALKVSEGGEQLPEVFDQHSFHVVTMLDVIEHLQDPYGYLGRVARLIKNNGLLIIQTPNANSWLFRIPRKIRVLVPSREKRKIFHESNCYHLYFFTPETLSRLLGRLSFTTLEIQTSESYYLETGQYLSKPVKHRINKLLTVIGLGHYLGQILVIARYRE